MTSFIEIFCDFDGTITTVDSVDFLLEELAHPSWHEVEARWERGEIGSRQCMSEQVGLIEGGWPAVERALARVHIDPTFPAFVAWCRQQGIALRIVSDGLDRTIDHVLSREGLAVDTVIANHVVELADGRLSLTFPYEARTSGCVSGVCKCEILGACPASRTKVFIGDGRSDFCAAGAADVLFAKKKLADHCRLNGIPFVGYDNFSEIRAHIETVLLPKVTVVPPVAAPAPAL